MKKNVDRKEGVHWIRLTMVCQFNQVEGSNQTKKLCYLEGILPCDKSRGFQSIEKVLIKE